MRVLRGHGLGANIDASKRICLPRLRGIVLVLMVACQSRLMNTARLLFNAFSLLVDMVLRDEIGDCSCIKAVVVSAQSVVLPSRLRCPVIGSAVLVCRGAFSGGDVARLTQVTRRCSNRITPRRLRATRLIAVS